MLKCNLNAIFIQPKITETIKKHSLANLVTKSYCTYYTRTLDVLK